MTHQKQLYDNIQNKVARGHKALQRINHTGTTALELSVHYENTPIQIYKKNLPPKTENFQIQKF